MNSPGIRLRLAGWYSLILAISLSLFAGAAYFAMQRSARTTLDEGLRQRVDGIRNIIATDQPQGLEAFRDELSEYQGGEGLQGELRVADASGRVVFASSGLRAPSARLLRARPGKPFRARIGGRRFRVLRQSVPFAGQNYDVLIAHSSEDFDAALEQFRIALWLAVPLFLAIAAGGGFWLSGRALRPVDEITSAARSIGAHDLSRRLLVPRTGDELARLAETLNEMLARLETSFERIVQFTADASHELRTPVSVVRTSAEIALRKSRTPEEYRAALGTVLEESEKLSRLIEQLALLARADAQAALRLERTDLTLPLREACRQANVLAQAKRLAWREEIPGDPVWIHGEAMSLERLFLALLDNAVKYTPDGGQVQIRLRREDGFALAEVRDTGIGISREDLPHVFERFYRADRSRSRETGGSGLGLAIGSWITAAHHGEIRVESAPSNGSCFEVRLPLCRE